MKYIDEIIQGIAVIIWLIGVAAFFMFVTIF